MDFPCCSQDLLSQWVIGSLVVGVALFVVGARAAGAALVGSSVGAFASLFTPFHSGHLETLVLGAVILGSVGLVVSGIAGLALGVHWLGRYPVALALGAVGTIVVGTLLILRIHADAPPPCLPRACFRGFEDPWVQGLLVFNVAFLALLFLVQAWQATRSSRDDPLANWLLAPFARGGLPFLL
jgi:hypothetical protein